MPDLTAAFHLKLDSAIACVKSEFPKEDWLAAGFKPRQDEAWWRERGPEMCNAFADWYTSQPDIRIWFTPDGKPAIELELEVMFGDIPVKIAPDVILKAGTALIVVDLKTGSAKPENYSQLGRQATAIEIAYGIRPKYGTFFLARGVTQKDGSVTHLLPPVTLDGPQYSREFYSREFAAFDQAVSGGIFIANPGGQCRTCGVNRGCLAFGGEEAGRWGIR